MLRLLILPHGNMGETLSKGKLSKMGALTIKITQPLASCYQQGANFKQGGLTVRPDENGTDRKSTL